ncbi:MAG: tyrosine-protein phosphatase [Actinomycetota bacterium]|nr:tyrosine-protein phosphatase [Actinomycetota bacterium]
MTSQLQDSPDRWITLEGAVNVRDLGGLPVRGGAATRQRVLLRSDNLQDLTETDLRRLREDVGLSDVVDLRTSSERSVEGPGPLDDDPDVRVHHWSLLPEAGDEAREVDGDVLMPWQAGPDEVPAPRSETRGVYVSYLRDRPASVVGALRTVAHADGAVVVHCAAGKDRTGVLVALALDLVEVDRDAVVADYLLTSERIDAIIARLAGARAYASNLRERSRDSHLPRAEGLEDVFRYVDADGGTRGWLGRHGWRSEDTDALWQRLRD